MPFDSTNRENDLKNIFAEIRSLRAEVADMQSALLSVQEKYDNAVVEIQKLNKNFSALEELLRIVAANQMLGEVEKNLPKQNQNKTPPNVSAGKKKKIFICGQTKTGKTTLADTLKLRIQNLEIIETSIDVSEVPKQINADLIIFVLDEKVCTYYTQQRFCDLLINNGKILVVVNPTEKFPDNKDSSIFEKFKSDVSYYHATLPSDWEKVSVVYVSLIGAVNAWKNSNFYLFRKSNFEEIDEFINAL